MCGAHTPSAASSSGQSRKWSMAVCTAGEASIDPLTDPRCRTAEFLAQQAEDSRESERLDRQQRDAELDDNVRELQRTQMIHCRRALQRQRPVRPARVLAPHTRARAVHAAASASSTSPPGGDDDGEPPEPPPLLAGALPNLSDSLTATVAALLLRVAQSACARCATFWRASASFVHDTERRRDHHFLVPHMKRAACAARSSSSSSLLRPLPVKTAAHRAKEHNVNTVDSASFEKARQEAYDELIRYKSETTNYGRLRAMEMAVGILADTLQCIELPTGMVIVLPDGRALAANSDAVIGWFAEELGLAAALPDLERAVTGAVRRLKAKGARRGTPVLISALAPDGSVLFRRDTGTFYRVTAEGYTVVQNGWEGCVLTRDDEFEPVGELPAPSEKLVWPVIAWLATRFAFIGFKSNGRAGILVILTLVFLALPAALVGAAPIPTFLGEGGAGKTTLLRVLLRLLLGPRAQVQPPPEKGAQDSIETVFAAHAVLGLDDPSHQETPWLSALMRSLVTGTTRERRRKYSDAETIILDLVARLMLAANALPFGASDANVSRLMPIWMKSATDERLPEGTVENEGLLLRAQFWADMIELVRRALAAGTFKAGTPSPYRLAGHYSLMVGFSKLIDPSWQEPIIDALGTVQEARDQLVLQDDAVADAVTSLAASESFMGSTTVLLGKLYAQKPVPLPRTWTAATLGRHLAEIAPALARARSIKVEKTQRTKFGHGWSIGPAKPQPTV